MSSATRVAIILLARGGCYLVRQRPELPGSPMPGYWEFPGGKCEPDETAEAAAVRECWEEAGLVIEIQSLRRVIVHEYAHGLVELHFFDARCVENDAQPAPLSGFRWLLAQELPALQFPGANEPVVAELVRESQSRCQARSNSP